MLNIGHSWVLGEIAFIFIIFFSFIRCFRMKQGDITISQLSHRDERIPAVVDLVNRAYRTNSNWTNEEKLVGKSRTNIISFRKEMQRSPFLIAESNSEIIGVIKTGLSDESFTRKSKLPELCGYIGLFAVNSSFQSRGVGTRLMKSAEEFCRKAGAQKMVR